MLKKTVSIVEIELRKPDTNPFWIKNLELLQKNLKN